MGELKKAIAFIFQTKSKDALTESEFVLAVAMDLRWFPPGNAEKLLKTALTAEIVEKKGEEIVPTFAYAEVTVPLGFKPGPEVLEPPEEKNLFEQIIDVIEDVWSSDRRSIVAAINKEHGRMANAIDIELAALMIAKKHGVDIVPYLNEIEKRHDENK